MSPVLRLVRSEQRLFRRDPVGLLFVVAFPVLVVLLIAGSFEPDDPSFGGAPPADYYLASYLGVVLAAVAFVLLPSHLAGYRERGVVRRFAASHFPGWALPTAWGVVAASLCLLGVGTVVATMALAYGLPAMADPAVVVLALVLGIAMCISIGLLLGMLLPSARSAQGVGLVLFFASFLLGGGGPPRDVMPGAMRVVADVLPTTHVVRALQRGWLGIGRPAGPDLAITAAVAVAATTGWVVLTRRARSFDR